MRRPSTTVRASPTPSSVTSATSWHWPVRIWKLHNQPWTDPDFTHPVLEGIDFPQVVVRQAYWDAEREVLVITLEPGSAALSRTSFRVTRLDPKRGTVMLRDGEILDELSAGSGSEGEGTRRVDRETLEVITSLAVSHRFELRSAH